MKNDLDKDAQLGVKVSNIIASEAEFKRAKSLIQSGLGSNLSPIAITSMSNVKGGIRYEISFRVFDPKRFRTEQVQEWLYEVGVVGWSIHSTLVRPE